MVRCLVADVRAVVPVAAEVAGRGVDVLPAGLRHLRGVRGRPELLADVEVSGPRLVRDHQRGRRVRQIRVDRCDQRPVDVGRHLRVDVAPVDRPGHRRSARVVVFRAVLAGPELFSGRHGVGGAGTGRHRRLVRARVVRADDVDAGRERRVGDHRVGHAPVGIGADHLRRVAVRGDGGVQVLVERLVVAAFVPAAEIVDGQAVAGGAAEPVHQVGDRGGGEERSEEPGRAPGQTVELDVGISGLRLRHQPPLVAAVAVEVAGRVFVAGLGAVGGVGVAADLDLEDLQRRAVARLEQVVEDLAALRLRIVDQQPAVAAAAADRPDAVESATRRGSVDGDRVGREGGRRRGGDGDAAGQQAQDAEHSPAPDTMTRHKAPLLDEAACSITFGNVELCSSIGRFIIEMCQYLTLLIHGRRTDRPRVGRSCRLVVAPAATSPHTPTTPPQLHTLPRQMRRMR